MSKVQKKQAKRRIEIIESVVPLITTEKFEDIGVADICRTAGISTGTFYHYFNKKSDLLIGLLWAIDADLEENVFPLLTCEDELENLRIFAHGWAQHIDRHGLDRSKMISAINPESAGFTENDRSSVRRIREIFSSAREKGQITDCFSDDFLTAYFLLMLRSVSTDWSRREGSYDIIRKMDDFTEFFIRGCKGGSDAKP